jgi:hypothetical protein
MRSEVSVVLQAIALSSMRSAEVSVVPEPSALSSMRSAEVSQKSRNDVRCSGRRQRRPNDVRVVQDPERCPSA